MGKFLHITEIMPENIPDWADEAMERGQLFQELVVRMDEVTKENEILSENNIMYRTVIIKLVELGEKWLSEYGGYPDIHTRECAEELFKSLEQTLCEDM